MSSIEINKQKSKKIVNALKKKYGKERPLYLFYHKSKQYEFLFSVLMSAQSTDKQVNVVTKKLYKKYTSLEDFANANLLELEKDIFSTGFYHNKAKNIKETANILLTHYNGKVPDKYEELIKLKGVGRKTANVVLFTLFDKNAMAVDTHVKRIANRLFGFNEKNVDKICDMLEIIVAPKDYSIFNTHIIALGREICLSNPKCSICILSKFCNYYRNEKLKT